MKRTIKSILFCLLALIYERSTQADPVVLVQQGRAALAIEDLAMAHAKFQQALLESPNDANANLFFAATRIASVSTQPAAHALFNRLGLHAAGRDIYDWQSKPATNSFGDTIIPAGVSAAELFTFIHDTWLPEIVGAEQNLAKITNPSFIINVTAEETTMGDGTIDYGDILVLRAGLEAFKVFLYTITSWNMDVQLTSLHDWLHEENITLEDLLKQYPNLLGAGSNGDLASSRAAFTAAIDRYVSASAAIRARATGVERLFNLDTNATDAEGDFRKTLEDLRASLNGPVSLRSAPNRIVHAARFFESVVAPRNLLPRAHENTWIAGSLPDATFGGIFTGLTTLDLEEGLAHVVEPASMISDVRRVSPTQLEITVRTAPWTEMVLDVSTNLIDWRQLAYAEFSIRHTNRWVVLDLEAPATGTRFYRASSFPSYHRVFVYGAGGHPVRDAVVTVNPGNVTIPISYNLDVREPVPGVPNIILDTDPGADVDDMSDMAITHNLVRRGEIKLLAVVASHPSPYGGALIEIMNRWYGHPYVQIGIAENGNTMPDSHGTPIRQYYPSLRGNDANQLSATTIYRRTLAAAADKSVTIVFVGQLRNLLNLWNSPSDRISTRTGPELIAAKVKEMVIVAGYFPNSVAYGGAEYNMVVDITGSQILNSIRGTIPIRFMGCEQGNTVPIPSGPGGIDQLGQLHPVRVAHQGLGVVGAGQSTRPSWGGLGLLYAVRGASWTGTNFFSAHSGWANIESTGHNTWTVDPNGSHQYLVKTQPDSVYIETLTELLLNSQHPRYDVHTRLLPAAPFYTVNISAPGYRPTSFGFGGSIPFQGRGYTSITLTPQ